MVRVYVSFTEQEHPNNQNSEMIFWEFLEFLVRVARLKNSGSKVCKFSFALRALHTPEERLPSGAPTEEFGRMIFEKESSLEGRGARQAEGLEPWSRRAPLAFSQSPYEKLSLSPFYPIFFEFSLHAYIYIHIYIYIYIYMNIYICIYIYEYI